MRRSRMVFLVLLIFVFGCSKKELLIVKLPTYSENVVERRLASSANPQCLQEVFSVKTLKDEIDSLEGPLDSGPRLTGKWRHLDLKDLPVPQASFLRTFGSKIGDMATDSIDYSGCQDLPCLFNRIYGKNDHVAGYVHYLWYLKFKNMLSADNLVPDQVSMKASFYNGKNHSLQSYLYSDDELYGLWRLSHMLTTPHTTLTYLKEVQRLPRGENFENQKATVCGLASMGGWIKLQDNCLDIWKYDKDSGNLYVDVTHELSHHVDFEEGQKNYQSHYRSSQQDYLDLMGMYQTEEYMKNGYKTKWAFKEGMRGVTEYAEVSPAENFAEALAHFRHEGALSQTVLKKEQNDFLSKNYYQGRLFWRTAILETWVDKHVKEIHAGAMKMVLSCVKAPTDDRSYFFDKNELDVDPLTLNCLGREAKELSRGIKAKVLLKEPEGCTHFKNNMNLSEWENALKVRLNPWLQKHLAMLKSDKNYLTLLETMESHLENSSLSRKAIVKCFGEKEEQRCYENEIKLLASSLEPEIAELYGERHPYEGALQEVRSAYETFLFSQTSVIRQKSTELWEMCKKLPPDDTASPTGHLPWGDGYLISSFHNCLSANLDNALKSTLHDMSYEKERVSDEKEEKILRGLLEPQFVGLLGQYYQEERALEEKQSGPWIDQEKGKIKESIYADTSWATDVLDPRKVQEQCLKKSLNLISFVPVYHLKKELFGKTIEGICSNASTGLDYGPEKVFQSLEGKMILRGGVEAMNCVKLFPISTALEKLKFKKSREACLDMAWPAVEKEVLKEFDEDAKTVGMKISKDDVKSKLEAQRRLIKLKLYKQYFQI